ncbi:hypothetical protein P0Y35_09090 [Kiritimatiellaeota bacterium B1221]|nr:hypothetical protein [Kiritimatiellaeota bacterium B1221]
MNSATPESRIYAEVFRPRLRGSLEKSKASTSHDTGSICVSNIVNDVADFRINAGLGRRGNSNET